MLSRRFRWFSHFKVLTLKSQYFYPGGWEPFVPFKSQSFHGMSFDLWVLNEMFLEIEFQLLAKSDRETHFDFVNLLKFLKIE